MNSEPFLTMCFLYFGFLFLLPYPARGYGHLPAAKTGSSSLMSIYQLGDSLSDTGNLIIESPNGVASAFARLPYGESFLKHPTGRCSNGLLMIDFLGVGHSVPESLLKHGCRFHTWSKFCGCLNTDADFTHGVNFAVAGATALPAEFLAEKSIVNPVTNSSLSVQLDWMWSHFNSICYNDQDCAAKLKNSLFKVGEIGSNDYYSALSQGKSMKDVNSMVFDVVQAIIEGIKRVIQSGAAKIFVPGSFPLGHFPAYIAACQAKNSATNRKQRLLNNLSAYHNDELQKRLQLLNQEYKNVTVIYGDYFNAFNRLLLNAPRAGFNGTSDVRKACCGTGGRFNFNPNRTCGARGVPVCANPDGYVIWD